MAYNSKFTGAQIDALLDASGAMQTSKEDVANKVTSIDAAATDVQYPSAKAVWATSIINSRNFPLSLEQGTIVLATQEIKADSTRVFTKCLVDPSVIKSITTNGNIQMYFHIYDREGNYIESNGWLTSCNFQKDRRYLLTFSKTTTTNSITPEEVLEAISIEYVKDVTITDLSSENYITIKNTSINNLLLTDRYFAVDASVYLPKKSEILSGFKCISMRVKAGDVFTVHKLTGGTASARAYATFDKDGNRLFLADAGLVLDETNIEIEQDGYIVFNGVSSKPISITAKKATISLDWAYSYLVGLLEHYSSSSASSSSEIQDLSPFFMKNAYIPLTTPNPSPDPGTSIAGNYNCISIKVKAGDYFIPTGMVGGSSAARVYGIFDKYGNLLSIGGESEELNEQINIEQDGYIVFNAVNNGFLLYGHFNFFDDWNWMYIVPIMQNLLNVIPVPSQLSKIQKDLYGVNLQSTEWTQNAYFHIANVTTAIPTTPIALSGFKCAEILCAEGERFQIKVVGGGNARAWAFLNKDRIVITRADANVQFEGEITAPEGTNSLIVHTTTTGYVKKLAVWDKSEEGTKEKVKILCFGNSFTQDSMSYVPMIIKNIAPSVELTLGMAVIGGCPLVQHLASFTGENQILDGVTYEPENYAYCKSTNGEPWVNLSLRTPDYMLADEEWDIITFQQNGGDAFKDWDTYYAPFIFKLHKSVFDKITRNIKIGWLLTHGAYASNDEGFLQNWQGTADNAKKMLDVTGTSILFPYGTAIQNLRSTSLKALGDGSAHNMTADNGHLQDGIGCMTAAYANAITILKSIGIDKIGVIGETTRVDANFINSNNVQGSNLGNSGVVGVTDDNCYLAQVAAECAVKKPYEVTDLTAIESGI